MTRIESPFEPARLDDEWLEADGFGGFASGTLGMPRTRRYHALLLAATRAPGGRMVLVNGVEAWLEAGGQRHPLTMQRYGQDVIYPDLRGSLVSFDTSPWPTWRVRVDPRTVVVAEVFVSKATCETVLRWRFEGSDLYAAVLKIRALLSGRDYHALHHENPAFNFDARTSGDTSCVSWQPYGGVPVIHAATNGTYAHAPDWYRNFYYAREQERGLDCNEDLATPGVFSFDLAAGDAVMILSASPPGATATANQNDRTQAAAHAVDLAHTEQQRRDGLGSRLQRSADAYVVTRNQGRTIVAGFPWFTDWGRDTFIAMRGLLIASNRLDDAEAILLEWSGTLSGGMLPNRFPDYGDAPEYNSVDASLWFIVAVHDYLATPHASAATRARLQQAAETILTGYTNGTRYIIGACSDDGLLRAGMPGVQLTWMDAKVGDWVVTPRIGKPVEVQALWI
ncbi:glycogen debranching enzyme N-terminal domain-containing protein, partial [Paraburkholderia sp.]|uniref:glycogen debranching enzyme N-terminal domain-containing protein n=1 Tax=Paraburkholderia sp. TaxID=1926495 RepID=UPI002F3F602D